MPAVSSPAYCYNVSSDVVRDIFSRPFESVCTPILCKILFAIMISSPVDIPRLRARQHIERRMATTKESAAAPQNRPMIVNLRRRESEFEDEDAVGLAITAEEVGLASSAEHCKGRSKN